MIAKTDFQASGAADLVQYIKRDDKRQVPVKNHTGRELDQEQLQQFIDVSEEYGMERHFIIAPDPEAGFDPDEVDRNVRTVMNDWRGDRRGTQYVYAVHGHDQRPHAHVAVTGRKDALRMNKQDIVAFRERAREAFDERERLADRAKRPDKQAAVSSTTATATAEPDHAPRSETSSPQAATDTPTDQQGVLKGLLKGGESEPSSRADTDREEGDGPVREPANTLPDQEGVDAEAEPEPAAEGDPAPEPEPESEPEPDPEPERDYW